MIIGEEKLAETADALRQTIERDCDPDDLAEIDEVFTIVAVHYGPAEGNEDAEVGQVFYRCTSARPHVQFGLLEQARRAINKTIEAI